MKLLSDILKPHSEELEIVMENKKVKIIIVGAAWYGDWARLLWKTYLRLGFDAKIVYNNAAPAALGGSSATATSLFEKSKRIAKQTLGPRLFKFLKNIRKRLSEYEILSRVGRVDVEKEAVVVIFTWNSGTPWVLKRLKKRRGVTLVLWQGEPPVRDLSWELAYDYFDHIFIVDEGLWMDEFPERIKKRARLLPLSSDDQIFYPLQKPVIKYQADISFVGQYVLSRAETLAHLKDFDLKIYGFGWEKGFIDFPWLKEKYKGSLPTEALNDVYNSTKVVIGTLGDPVDPHTTTTMRTFDIALAGGFQISQQVALTKKLFGESIPMYKTDEELVSLVRDYLGRDEDRKRMAFESHKIALSHTYAKRAEEILRVCELNK